MPKIVDHDEYRKELLANSFECFASKGYGQLTMRRLAEHLNVSTGTLYHYFKSKEQIFEELVDYQAANDLRLAADLDMSSRLDERVTNLVGMIVEHRSYLTKQCLVWLDFGRQHGFARLFSMPAVQAVYAQYMSFLKSYLAIEEDEVLLFVYSYLCGFCTDPYLLEQTHSVDKQCRLLYGFIQPHSKLE